MSYRLSLTHGLLQCGGGDLCGCNAAAVILLVGFVVICLLVCWFVGLLVCVVVVLNSVLTQ